LKGTAGSRALYKLFVAQQWADGYGICEKNGEDQMPRIAILYCKRIKDHSCTACVNCLQGIQEKNGEFARYEEIDLCALTDCGDCPGLVVPRVKQLKETLRTKNRQLDVVHLGTCVKLAMETSACPIDFDDLKIVLEKQLGVPVVLGTYSQKEHAGNQ
jgi:predicted metal-binding protein